MFLNQLKINRQLLSYKPGQNAYNFLNAATGWLKKILTGGSRLFNYEYESETRDKTNNLATNNYEKPQNTPQRNYHKRMVNNQK